MAKITRPADTKGSPPPPPPRPFADSKGSPPPPDERSHNLSKRSGDRTVLINFKATEEFRKELKIYATELGLSITNVIMEAIELHKQKSR